MHGFLMSAHVRFHISQYSSPGPKKPTLEPKGRQDSLVEPELNSSATGAKDVPDPCNDLVSFATSVHGGCRR